MRPGRGRGRGGGGDRRPDPRSGRGGRGIAGADRSAPARALLNARILPGRTFSQARCWAPGRASAGCSAPRCAPGSTGSPSAGASTRAEASRRPPEERAVPEVELPACRPGDVVWLEPFLTPSSRVRSVCRPGRRPSEQTVWPGAAAGCRDSGRSLPRARSGGASLADRGSYWRNACATSSHRD
jgi:hypothetical protein